MDTHGLTQKTPDACGTTLQNNMPPMAFKINQTFAVVFPLLSESQRLLWVHSNDINLQLLDCVAELDKAFDSFPYLTQKQTIVVAKRCSLHPDQVKVWFMLQRLRYGISWDYKDIQEVRKKFKTSQRKAFRKEELQSMDTKKKKNQKGKVKVCGINKAGKVKKEHVAKKKGEKMKAAGQLERQAMSDEPINQEKNSKVEKANEDWYPQRKRKRRTVRKKIEKKMKQDGDGAVERVREEETRGDQIKIEEEKSCKSKRTHSIGTEKRTMMKLAFSTCQYPNSEDLNHLAVLIDIPRSQLVQWFRDMRYYVKTRRPLWMSQEQHRQVLANIQHRQNMYMQAKEAVSEFRGEATWKRVFQRSENPGKDENIKALSDMTLQDGGTTSSTS